MATSKRHSLIGRKELLSELRRLLYAPAPEEVPLMILDGEEGIGKSILLRTATTDAREHGYVVLEGRSQAAELQRPFYLLRELLNSLDSQRMKELALQKDLRNLLDFRLGTLGAQDRSSLPMGLIPLGGSLGSPEGWEKRLLAELSGTESSRQAEKLDLFDRIAGHLDDLAAKKKLLLSMDDLQYADQASIDFLGHLVRRTMGRNIRVMAASRPEAEIPGGVQAVLTALEHEGLARRLMLKPLTEEESRELVTYLTEGQMVPTATASDWLARSRGNPLALVQLSRGGVTETEASAGGAVWVKRVLATLGPEAREILLHATIFGKSFGFQPLYIAIGGDEEKLAERLEAMIHDGILMDHGDEVYEFANDELWKEVYNSIPDGRWKSLHQKVAEAYEKMHPDPPPELISEMARHFYLGGVHDKSLTYNRYAASLASGAFSPDVAIKHLERARVDLAALPGDHRMEEAELLKEMGEMYSATGDHLRADGFYTESLSKLPEGEDRLRALMLLSKADAAREQDQLEALHRYCDEAIVLLEKTGPEKGLAMAHRNLARAAFKEGKYDVGEAEILAAIELLDPEKDARDVAHCYSAFANVISVNPAPEEQERALVYYNKAIGILEPQHDYKELARIHNNMAIEMGFTNPRETLNQLKEAHACAEKCKDQRLLGWALFNSVEFHLALGEEEEAARNNLEARKILSRLNDPIGMQQLALNDGILAQRRKSYEEAEKAYMESLRRAEKLDYTVDVVETLMHMASNYADWGKRPEAIRAVNRIKKLGEDKFNPMNKPKYKALKKRLGVEGFYP